MEFKHKYILIILFFPAIFYVCGCSVIRPQEYIHVRENEDQAFSSIFIPSLQGDEYKQVVKALGLRIDIDTMRDQFSIIYRKMMVDNNEVFYPLNSHELLMEDPDIEEYHFLSSAMLFRQDGIYLYPAEKRSNLSGISIANFKLSIPGIVHKKDTIVIRNRGKKSLLRFRIVNFQLGGRMYNHALRIDITEIWPDATYKSTVWLDKNIGILQWIRPTGKIDTRLLDSSINRKESIK